MITPKTYLSVLTLTLRVTVMYEHSNEESEYFRFGVGSFPTYANLNRRHFDHDLQLPKRGYNSLNLKEVFGRQRVER